jgi:hypothetical protein
VRLTGYISSTEGIGAGLALSCSSSWNELLAPAQEVVVRVYEALIELRGHNGGAEEDGGKYDLEAHVSMFCPSIEALCCEWFLRLRGLALS